MVLLHRRSGVVVDKMHHTLKMLAVLLLAFRYSEGRIVFSKNGIVRQLTPQCTEGQFKCESSGRCIRSLWLCDRDNDCGDNSDEPNTCPGRCAEFSDWFKCVNHDSCFHKSMMCDGIQQCGDGTDEPSFCPAFTCDENSIKCRTKNKCVSIDAVCNGVNDCEDGTDEPEDCRTRICPDGTLKCNSGQCISKDLFCRGGTSCRDSTQFPDVSCPPIECDVGYTKCPGVSKCIQSNYFCDGDNDCGDRSDEPDSCSRGDFKYEDDGSGELDSIPNEPVLECPPNFVRPTTGGSCYKLGLTPMSWQNASEYCASILHGAHLVFIDNRHEQRIVVNLLTDYTETSWWIGGERLQFTWSWRIHSPQGRVTSIQMSYKNWAPSEPNNAGVGESCIALMNMAWWEGQWNDDVCSKVKHFICEF